MAAQPAGVPRLLPRFYRFQQAADERKLARVLLESGGEATPAATNGRPLTRSADGHEWQRRRGLPLLGRGVGGTAPGTSPLGELLRRENQRRPR